MSEKQKKTFDLFKIETKRYLRPFASDAKFSEADLEAAKKQIMESVNQTINGALLYGAPPENFASSDTHTHYENTSTFTPADYENILKTYSDFRKKTEVEINGVTINAADYEEVTDRNRQFLPAGWRVYLNTRRTTYDRTFEPLPTDLFLINEEKHAVLLIGGNKTEFKPLWKQFIDENRITSKERLFYIAAARSPAKPRGEITEDSRRHLEAEIFAATSGKIKFSELETMEDWRLAILYKESVLDKKNK